MALKKEQEGLGGREPRLLWGSQEQNHMTGAGSRSGPGDLVLSSCLLVAYSDREALVGPAQETWEEVNPRKTKAQLLEEWEGL